MNRTCLVGGVFVDLVVLDEAVDAKCGNDTDGGNHDDLDNFSHKEPPAVVFALKYFFFDEKQAYFYNYGILLKKSATILLESCR